MTALTLIAFLLAAAAGAAAIVMARAATKNAVNLVEALTAAALAAVMVVCMRTLSSVSNTDLSKIIGRVYSPKGIIVILSDKSKRLPTSLQGVLTSRLECGHPE